MKPEFKKQWLEALRSGKYRQGRMVLRNKHDFYCCLGVLCDIIDPEGWKPISVNGGVYSFDGDHKYLREFVMEETGLDVKEEHNLINMNDQGYSFEQIANYIEKKL